MTAEKPRLLVLINSTEDESSFEKFMQNLSPVLETDKYSIEAVKRSDFALTNLNQKCAAIFVLDCEKSVDDECRDILTKFVFGPSNGRAMLFCDLTRDAPKELWLLKNGVKDSQRIPEVTDLFKKFIKKEDIPINRQAVQLTGAETDDEFTVALVRVENAVEYLSVSAETGSQAIFVASTAENAFRQPKAVWSDLANSLNLDIAEMKPQPVVNTLAASSETVLVYTGMSGEDDERFAKFDAAVKAVLKPDSFKYRHLDRTKLSSDINLPKICKALLLAPSSSKEFDVKSRKNLLMFFSNGGKMIFFGENEKDPEWMWFLKFAFKDQQQNLSRIESVFEKFVRGERIPTNLQTLQLSNDEESGNEFCAAFIKVENVVPVLYLSRENGSTVAFAASSPEKVMEQNLMVWKDLLRLVDVVIVPGQEHRYTFGRILSRIEDEALRNTVPNLFVYNGRREDAAEFDRFFKILRNVLRRDTYSVYPLSHELFATEAWMPYCKALIVSTEKSSQIESDVRKFMETYFKRGGKLMFFCDMKTDEEALWFLETALENPSTVSQIREGFKRFDRSGLMPINLIGKQTGDKGGNEQYLAMMRVENAASVLYLSTDSGGTVAFIAGEPVALLDQNVEVWKDIVRVLDLDVSTSLQPALTSGYMISRDKELHEKAAAILKSPKESSQEIAFIKTTSETDSPTFPLRLYETHKDFNSDEYFKSLHTKTLGAVSVFIPVVRSVSLIASSLRSATNEQEIVVIAGQQISGEGGFKKQWVSPQGAASFAFVMRIPRKSNLGKHVTIMKSLTALAVVNGIKSTTNYAEIAKSGNIFPIGVKWPNDIYFGKNVKIGGVLEAVTETESEFLVNVGIGINVSNQRPTACLNDFILDNTTPFKIETIVASTLNQFEILINDVEANGLRNIISAFESNCVNMHQEITLYKTKEKGSIVGLDDYGNLKVKLNDNDQIVSVTYDSTVGLRLNSLDFLIRVV